MSIDSPIVVLYWVDRGQESCETPCPSARVLVQQQRKQLRLQPMGRKDLKLSSCYALSKRTQSMHGNFSVVFLCYHVEKKIGSSGRVRGISQAGTKSVRTRSSTGIPIYVLGKFFACKRSVCRKKLPENLRSKFSLKSIQIDLFREDACQSSKFPITSTTPPQFPQIG